MTGPWSFDVTHLAALGLEPSELHVRGDASHVVRRLGVAARLPAVLLAERQSLAPRRGLARERERRDALVVDAHPGGRLRGGEPDAHSQHENDPEHPR